MSIDSWWSIIALLLASVGSIFALAREKPEEKHGHWKRRKRLRYALYGLTLAALALGIQKVHRSDSANKGAEEKHRHEREADEQQIGGLNLSIETQIRNNELQYTRHQEELRHLQDQVSDLKKDIATQELRTKLEAVQTRLDKALAPAPKAKLEFSFWQYPLQDQVVKDIYTPVDGNLVTFDFSFFNHSDVPAKDAIIWLRICERCKFHSEPPFSQKVVGAPESDRMYSGISVPPGVWWEKLTVQVEVPSSPIHKIGIAFRYRCDACEIEKDLQQAWITLGRPPLRSFSKPLPPPKKH